VPWRFEAAARNGSCHGVVGTDRAVRWSLAQFDEKIAATSATSKPLCQKPLLMVQREWVAAMDELLEIIHARQKMDKEARAKPLSPFWNC